MDFIQVICSIEEKFKGPSYSVLMLAKSLINESLEGNIMSTSSRPYSNFHHGVEQIFCKRSRFLFFNLLCHSRELKTLLLNYAKISPVIHCHGIWQMPSIYSAIVAKKTSSPCVISPRGMLSVEARKFGRFKKFIFWNFLQKKSLYLVDCFHATSTMEALEIRNLGFRQPIAIIPNGIHLPKIPKNLHKEKIKRENKVALYLGRIHPKKSILDLIYAWSKIEHCNHDWKLKIVGPMEGNYASKIRNEAKKLQLKIEFIDGIYDDQKSDLYFSSDLFILPSLNENFGMVVAEALAHQLPVIATKGTPWEGLKKNECGWHIDHDIDSIKKALVKAIELSNEQRLLMGINGYEWMKRDYSWSDIGRKTRELYQWLRCKTNKPGFII